MERAIRVLIAKAGLDAHDKGARLVARGLKEAGMEVVYTGLYQTPEQVVEAALQEDADVVGLSVHTGGHRTLFPRIREMLNERNARDVILIGGGAIPYHDADVLKELGVAEEIFPPGTPITAIEEWIKQAVARRRATEKP